MKLATCRLLVSYLTFRTSFTFLSKNTQQITTPANILPVENQPQLETTKSGKTRFTQTNHMTKREHVTRKKERENAPDVKREKKRKT